MVRTIDIRRFVAERLKPCLRLTSPSQRTGMDLGKTRGPEVVTRGQNLTSGAQAADITRGFVHRKMERPSGS